MSSTPATALTPSPPVTTGRSARSPKKDARGPAVPEAARPLPELVLVHGLLMNRAAMWPLAMRLRAAGFKVHLFGYGTLFTPLAKNADLLANFVQQRCSEKAVLLGHSLGGLVCTQALRQHPKLRVTDLVLLGCPFQGAAAARVLRRVPGIGRWLGRPLHDWAVNANLATPAVRVRTLAGTKPQGVGRVLCDFQEPNDGTVTVAETWVEGAFARQELAVSHMGMLLSPEVAAQVLRWTLTC